MLLQIKNLPLKKQIKFTVRKDTDPFASLCKAIKQNDLAAVQSYVTIFSSNINAQDRSGDTLLHIAVDRGSLEMIELMLAQKSININIKNNNQETALHRAIHRSVSKNNIKVVKLLIEKHANTNAQNRVGDTPLHSAITLGYINIVNLLITHPDTDINVQNQLGNTLLHIAVAHKFIDIVKILIVQPNINKELRNHRCRTPYISTTNKIIKEIINPLQTESSRVTSLKKGLSFGEMEEILFSSPSPLNTVQNNGFYTSSIGNNMNIEVDNLSRSKKNKTRN